MRSRAPSRKRSDVLKWRIRERCSSTRSARYHWICNPKLLRALQEQEFERLGGSRTIQVDVRIVAATNRDLRKMVAEGKFRDDLYYRLHVFPLTAPPLRERREDIPLLIRFFAQRYARKLNRPIEEIPSHALEALTNYNWPGNIRELQHLVERSVILSPDRVLQIAVPDAVSETVLSCATKAPRSASKSSTPCASPVE